MRRIGRVLHISPSRKAVIRAEKVPRVGETVFDDKQTRIGRVFDIIGPVASPYVEVDLSVKDPQSIVNSLLYVSSSSRHETMNRRRI